jgi:Protein of unknown function (DUF3489)
LPLSHTWHSPDRLNRPQIPLAISPKPSDECHDRNPVKEKSMSENAINSENTSKPVPETAKPKGARKAGKKTKPARKAARAKKAPAKPNADRTNKKADVIAMMKRAKGATLPEIMKATGWQPHTVRGFVSILGSKGGEKIESSRERRPQAYAAGASA